MGKRGCLLGFPIQVPLGVSGPIHIVSFYWFLETFEWKFGKRAKFKVDEVSSGATVNDCGGFDDLITH